MIDGKEMYEIKRGDCNIDGLKIALCEAGFRKLPGVPLNESAALVRLNKKQAELLRDKGFILVRYKAGGNQVLFFTQTTALLLLEKERYEVNQTMVSKLKERAKLFGLKRQMNKDYNQKAKEQKK